MFIKVTVEVSFILLFADQRIAVEIAAGSAKVALSHCSVITSQIRGAKLNLSLPFYFLIA